MKRTIYFSITLIGLVSSLVYFSTFSRNLKQEVNVAFRIIVNLDTTVVAGNRLITPVNIIKQENIRKLLTRFNSQKLQAVYRNRYNEKGFIKTGIQGNPTENWHQIILKNISKADELVALLKREKGVINVYLERPIPLKPCIAPNDPEYSSQWHLRSASYPVADIKAEQAWNINKGRNDVIIAVCDGGVDYTHRDLDPGDRSHVITGYDSGNDDNNPMDDLPTDNALSFGGHGTHVAGIIGAMANNAKQVSGVMWNCKIMPVKMVGNGSLTLTYPFGSTNWDFSTTAFPSDVADAIDYAVNNGARVINLSYGFDNMGSLINDVILRVPLLYSSILNAYNHNVVVVAAMGNEYNRGNPIQYPAAFREVIAVGNTTNSNPPSRYHSSSTGSHICISAPGTNIKSTVRGGGTDVKTGTSMAAPVVSGVAGLIISQGLDRNLNLTNDDVRHILERTTDDITGTGIGFDNETGYGKVNAFSALTLLNSPNEVFHGVSTGGTALKINTFDKWIYIGSRWGLASGTYLSVDQYQITQHVTFNVPYCSVPKVWIRERESLCMSFAQPNDGYPYSEITIITNTGFDVRFAAYYVRYNISGQAVNKWIPTTSASTQIAYTVAGQPNLAAIADPISGPSIVCSSGASFFVNNVPTGCAVSWTCSSNISFDNQTGNPKVFIANGTGVGTIQATLISSCGNVTLPTKTIWAGPPIVNSVTGASPLGVYQPATYYAEISNSSSMPDSYSWATSPSNGVTITSYGQSASIMFAQSGWYQVMVKVHNTCGWSSYAMKMVNIISGYSLTISPNPTTTLTTIELVPASEEKALQEPDWDLEVYDAMQSLKAKVQKVKGNKHYLNTSDWKDGVYIIKIRIGNEIINDKLVVKQN